MKQNKLIGDRDKKKPIEELLKKAIEDPAFQEAFGEKREESDGESFEEDLKRKRKPEEQERKYERLEFKLVLEVPHPQRVNDVSFSPSGLFATACSDRYARVFNFDKEKLTAVLRRKIKHPRPVCSVSYNPNFMEQFATGSNDGYLRIFDSKPRLFSRKNKIGKIYRIKPAGEYGVISVGYHPRGEYIATGGFDGYLRIFKLDMGLEEVDSKKENFPVDALCFNPDGKSIYALSSPAVMYPFDLLHKGRLSGPPIDLSFTGIIGKEGIAISNFTKLIAIGDHHRVKIYSLDDYVDLCSDIEHPGLVRGVSFSKDDQYLLTGCEDGVVRIYEITTGITKIEEIKMDYEERARKAEKRGEIK